MAKVRAIVSDDPSQTLIVPGVHPYASVTVIVYDGAENIVEQRRAFYGEALFAKLPQGGTAVNRRAPKDA